MEILTLESFKQKIFNFENSKDWDFLGTKPTIIDFYADWCAPCRALHPILENISHVYANLIDIYKIDTEATPELAALFEIRSIPSLLFIPQVGEPAMNAGLISEAGFEKAILDLFQINKP